MATDRQEESAQIVSIGLRNPRDGRELELRIDHTKYTVDAVFTSRDAIERILIQFYERLSSGDLAKTQTDPAELRAALERLLKDKAIVLGTHSATCKGLVPPPIHWEDPSPIHLRLR